ncbi:MAG: HAD family hydrolase [Candidatus Sungbacteria bacterium]|nr:HAD family hydrolase [Candidatus Sungbacteria bacterium]
MSPKETPGEKKNVFVFDGDDTLWMNEWQYSEAYANYFSYLYKIFEGKTPALHLIWERYFLIESELYKEWGVKKGRVAEAMVKMYHDLCKRVKFEYGEDEYRFEHEENIREIGDQPFQYERIVWNTGAQDVLRQLRRDGHTVCFLSSFDKEVFPHKAGFLKLYDFFDKKNVHITEFKKTKEDFITASGWKKEFAELNCDWYAVGNGESDVRPALEISERWRGIYIPHGSTSQYFRGKRGMDYWTSTSIGHPRAVTIRSISELFTVI